MPLRAGDKLGPYEILTPLGAGGMGEVYKARDTRLDRFVAIKVLPEHIARREDLRRRFEREARAVASLNHPHICVLHDIGNQDGTGYMVMEHLEGETLAARTARGALPLDQALRLATQIADALDRAHRAGVTHRDVKPANIMLTRDGVKVLDFGLAKSASKPGPAEETLATALTTEGTVMGTPQYMAPEQFEGKEADARADVWAFGAALYEMVTGQKAFQGKSYSSLVGAILSADPPPMSVRPFTPASLERLVRRCLAKDPEDRYQSMRDVVLDLQMPPQETSATPVRTSRWPWAAVVVLVALAGLNIVQWLRTGPPNNNLGSPVRRFAFDLPPGAINPVISPDGRHFVYVQGSPPRLWVQDLNQRQPRELAGTAGASKPFWSPDSRFIAFFALNEVRKVAVQGGPAVTVCEDAFCPYERQGAWSPDGSQIAFTAKSPTLIYFASASGGPARLVVNRQGSDAWFVDPLFMPGESGKGKLIFVEGRQSKIILQDLATGRREILATGTRPCFSATGHLIFSRGGIWAMPISLRTGGPEGEPFSIAPEGADPSVADDGTLTYQDAGGGMKQLHWYDRAGRKQAPIGKPMRTIFAPKLSRDERLVAVAGGDQPTEDIWILDIARSTNSRLTTAPGSEGQPGWTSKDKEIIYWKSVGSDDVDIMIQRADGSAAPRALVARPGSQYFSGISADGRHLFYNTREDPGKPPFTAYLDMKENTEKPALSQAYEGQGVEPSPDGRLVAIAGNHTGTYEVYVERIGGGGRVQISTQGGTQPRWNAAGNEMFYVQHDTLMALPVKLAPDFSAGEPVKLFSHPGLISKFAGQQYDVRADGQRFVLVDAVGGRQDYGRPVRLVQNWLSEFRGGGN